MNEREVLAGQLLDVMLQQEIKKFQKGKYTYQDVKNALQFCKDNNITVEVQHGKPLAELLEALPFNDLN
jgi:N-acetyl-beta-hexosaminidase